MSKSYSVLSNNMDNCRTVFPNTLRLFIEHFFKPYKIYFILFCLIDIFVAFYVPIQSYIIKKLVDAATHMLGKPALIDVTLFPAGCLIIFTILNLLSWRINNYLTLKSLPSLKANIIDEGSNYTRYHAFGFFQNHLSGAVSNRIIDLANNIEFLISNFRGLLRNLLVIVGAIAMSLVINLFFSLIFFMASVLIILASWYISKKIDPFAREFSNSRSIAFGTLMDSFVNIINVMLFAREQHEKTHLSGYLNNMASTDQLLQKKLMQYGFGMSGLSILVQTLIIGSLIYLGARGFLTAGDFVLIFMLTFSVLDHVWHFSDNLLILSEKLGVFKRALQLISTAHEIIDVDNTKQLIVSKGVIVFSRVKFFYTDSQKLFEDKTLVINGGEKIGLVGYSGSGKSSFVNLITRVFDIQRGDILIDNQSVRLVSLKSLRDNIGFIPQDPMLFHRNVMENIRYGKLTATDDEVIEIAKIAHMHEFIVKLPQGYQTIVGERGVKLSGGQRQRIAIARAMLKNAPILILDEATSALDSTTESLIQESLALAMHNKTVIVVAHRLSTIKSLDRILVFDKGRIVEEGTHEYLLTNGKIYKNLWRIQQIGEY